MENQKNTVVLATLPSDCHSWNIIFLQLLLSEMDYSVVNLGVCTPYDLVVYKCKELKPKMLIITTLNGHGYIEGPELAEHIRSTKELSDLYIFIGGKISTSLEDCEKNKIALTKAGFNAVFYGESDVDDFKKVISEINQKSGFLKKTYAAI